MFLNYLFNFLFFPQFINNFSAMLSCIISVFDIFNIFNFFQIFCRVTKYWNFDDDAKKRR